MYVTVGNPPSVHSTHRKGYVVNIKTIILAAAGVALVGAGIAAPSMADPTTTGRVLNGMGSDTTQFVMNGFSKTTNGANVTLLLNFCKKFFGLAFYFVPGGCLCTKF